MNSKRSFLNAIKWAYAGNWGDRAFSGLSTFILAALLGPKDFGLVSIALVYITFLQMFLDQGFMAALVQKRDLEQEHLDAVFWMDVALGVVLVALSVWLSGWWAARNHAAETTRLIVALSLCIPIQALSAVPGAMLSRSMNFKALSIRANAATIVGGLVGIVMALRGFGAWALVGQQLSRDVTSAILLWELSTWRPRVEFSWSHLKDLSGFAISNFTAQLGIFAEMQAGSVLLGLLFGPLTVGLYRLADRLASSVVTMATTSIQSVSLPEFARHQDHPAELRKSVLVCIRLGSIVTLPALSGMAAVSGTLLAVIGPQWAPASGALKVMCLIGMSIVFSCFTGPLLQALSKPHHLAALEWARMGIGTAIVVVAGFMVRNASVERQLDAIAVARFISMIGLVAPVFLYILMRICKISFREMSSAVAPSVMSSLSTVVAVEIFRFSGWLSGAKPLTLLSAEVAFGAISGVAVLLALDAQLRGAVSKTSRRILRVASPAVVSAPVD